MGAAFIEFNLQYFTKNVTVYILWLIPLLEIHPTETPAQVHRDVHCNIIEENQKLQLLIGEISYAALKRNIHEYTHTHTHACTGLQNISGEAGRESRYITINKMWLPLCLKQKIKTFQNIYMWNAPATCTGVYVYMQNKWHGKIHIEIQVWGGKLVGKTGIFSFASVYFFIVWIYFTVTWAHLSHTITNIK